MTRDKKKRLFFFEESSRTSLKSQSVRGGAVTLSAQGLLFVINIGSTMILARLLTPQDYGMISMVAAITAFAGIFSDLGLSTATIQKSNINHAQVSTLFWVNVGLGALVTLIVAVASPVVAWFYQTPQLLWVTAALSLNFLITGLGIQHKALLNRQMQFFDIAKVLILSRLLGVAVAVIVAMHGFRYWALVLNTLAISVCSSVGFCLAAKWLPGLPERKSGVRSMLRFGSDIAGYNVINYFSRNLDNILIGRFHGTASLGLYSKAYQLLMLPITNLRQPLNKVAMPALSRLQGEPERYRSYYIKFVSLLAFVSIPLVVYMFVCSENIIRLVLGRQWAAASDLFRILAFAALLQPVASTRGMVLLSLGKSRKCLWLGAANSFVRALAFIMGIPWGAKGVATAYAVSTNIQLWVAIYIAFAGTPVCVRDFLAAIYRPLTASLAVGVGCFLLHRFMGGFEDFFVLIICFVVSLPAYLVIYSILSGGTDDLREFLSYCRLSLVRN